MYPLSAEHLAPATLSLPLSSFFYFGDFVVPIVVQAITLHNAYAGVNLQNTSQQWITLLLGKSLLL